MRRKIEDPEEACMRAMGVGQIPVCSKPLRLKAANLARRSRTALDGFAADDPAHRRIVPQALGVIDVLVSVLC